MHAELEAKFRTSNGRTLRSRKLANNTWLERREGGRLAVRLHQTDVVTVDPDGTITLDSGGWYTMTTRERINRVIPRPLRLMSNRGRWYLGRGWDDYRWPFADGVKITPGLEVIIPDDAPNAEEQDSHNRRMNELIDGYIAHIYPQKILEAGRCDPCAAPSEGHLLSHLEGLTFTLTLATAVLGEARHPGYWYMVVADAERNRVNRYFTDQLRRHLRRKLLRGVATR